MVPAIQVENVSKQYRLGRSAGAASYRTLREDLVGLAAAPFRRLRGRPTTDGKQKFWALKDVCFTVAPGETIGIIGRNGAGKTTLLKVISRVTRPTRGRVRVRGQVGSLLEVGTGFHPELTGRENIFLSGVILGMRSREIQRRFEEIVEFSGVRRFIDLPIKRYSSGMNVRLGFAVAAYLRSDILLIDEVLAVGDLAFREKCFERLKQLREAGRTILVVSHYLAQVSLLTRRCIWIDQGRVRLDSATGEVLAAYSNTVGLGAARSIDATEHRAEPQQTTGKIEFAAVRTVDDQGRPCNRFQIGDDIIFELDVRVREPVRRVRFGVAIYAADGAKVLMQNTRLQGDHLPEKVDRDGTVRLRLVGPPLLAGAYTVWAGIGSELSNSADLAGWPRCHRFSVLAPDTPNANFFTYTDALTGTGTFRWNGQWELPWD